MKQSSKRFLSVAGFGSAVIFGFAASGQYVAHQQSAEIQQALRAVAAEVGSATVDPWRRRVSLARLVVVRPNFRMTVGSFELAAPPFAAFSLVGQAAAGVSTITAHDLKFEAGDSTVSIPRLEAQGPGLSGLDLARLFDPDSPKPLAERLAKLSVGNILAPEITLTPATGESGKKDRSISFRGLALADIVKGKIGSATLDGAEATYADKDGSTRTASLGRVSASKVDLPLALAIAQGSRTEAEAPLRPVYESFSIASLKARSEGTEGFEIGPIQSGALEGRPLLVPVKEAAALMEKAETELSDTDRARQAKILVDVLKSFSLGRFEVRDFSFDKIGGDNPASLKLGRFLIDGLETFRSRSIAAEHFELSAKNVRLTFSRSALDGVDGSGLVDVVGTANGPSDISPTPDQIRRLAPKLAAASLLDLKVEVPVADLTGNAHAGRSTIFSMPVAELRVGRFVGNLASDVASHLEAVYDVSSPAPDSSLEAMAKAGFGHLDVTSDYTANWSDSTKEFKLDQLSFAAKDLASLTFGGLLANMSSDLMSPDKATARQAAEQLQFRSLNIGLVNSGLAEKALPLAAASMNLSVPELKSTLVSQTNDFILKLLGSGPAADQLTGAVARFIEQPKTLDISVKAPESLSLRTVVNAENPQELLGKLEISAVANR